MNGKKTKKSRVTITFNGKKHTLDEWTRNETAADREQSLDWKHAFPNQEHDADSPLPLKTDKPPGIRRKQKKAIAISQRMQAAHEWIPTIKSFTLPALAAVAVGLMIGLSVLTIFATQERASDRDSASDGLSQGAASSPASPVDREAFRLQAYVVQAGVFSTAEAAQTEADQLAAMGLAAVTVDDGKAAVYLSAAATEEQAERLADDFRRRGISVYPKPWTIEPSAHPPALANARLAQAVAYGGSVLRQLLRLPASSADASHDSAQILKEAEQMVSKWEPDQVTGLDREAQRHFDQFINGTNDAVKHAEAYVKNREDIRSSATYQESLIAAIDLYRQWLK